MPSLFIPTLFALKKRIKIYSNSILLVLVITSILACNNSNTEPKLPSYIEDGAFTLSILESNGSITKYDNIFGKAKGEVKFAEILNIDRSFGQDGDKSYIYSFVLTAKKDANISIEQKWRIDSIPFAETDFLLPGFWYKRNLRSPKNAPSFKSSDSWSFREDRMSIPLVGTFDAPNKRYITVERSNVLDKESTPDSTGGIIRTRTSIGSLGMGKGSKNETLINATFPFEESPKSYQSKLSLKAPWKAFYSIKKGDTITVKWRLALGKANDFTDFVSKVWEESFDRYLPKKVDPTKTDTEIKDILTNYFYESYAETKDLKGFSGLWFNTKTCETTGVLSIGFCGKTFANVFNLLEYGYQTNNNEHIALANKVLQSYFKNGFTRTGLIRELVYGDNAEDTYTLRKQSEGIKNLLFILEFEKQKGREYPAIEHKLSHLLDRLSKMQSEDGSLQRKFDMDYRTIDTSKGSTQSIITPMIMAAYFFNNPEYLKVARIAGEYTEKNIIDQADYFSSTLDANCEDKEAAAIAAASFFHLAKTSEGAMKDHYTQLAKKAAYFGLSWYYLYDVPFAKESLLGSIGLKTRGWGNVSTENNHIDVWAFDFPHVLAWLAEETNEPRFAEMSKVIISSLRDQMLPYENHMVGVGKIGYMPEIVQHTVWDYGANGKGYLNSHMSVGWTVASIWEILSPGRFEGFIKRTDLAK